MGEASEPRPSHWAAPVAIEGADNLHIVEPGFYRSGQPSRIGFANLAGRLGIRSVVSLRAFHADDEHAGSLGLTLVRVPLYTWAIDEASVTRALAEVEVARERGPVLLHCQHGADRTGLVCALHRMLYQGWSRQEATREMREGAFGYHTIWANIPGHIRRTDIEALRTAIRTARRDSSA